MPNIAKGKATLERKKLERLDRGEFSYAEISQFLGITCDKDLQRVVNALGFNGLDIGKKVRRRIYTREQVKAILARYYIIMGRTITRAVRREAKEARRAKMAAG